MGRHLLFTNWRVTSSEAILPTLPKIAFVDRLNERLALVTEHLNCRPLIMYVPKYRISLTQGSLWPFMVDMLAHFFTSHLGPIRIQHISWYWYTYLYKTTQIHKHERGAAIHRQMGLKFGWLQTMSADELLNINWNDCQREWCTCCCCLFLCCYKTCVHL